MLVSLNWLEEILNTKLEVENLKKISLNLGLEVEDVKSTAPKDLVIGQILKITPHPSLKNLSVLRMKTNKIIHIVTAAKNIKQGDLLLTVPVGGTLNNQKVQEKNFNDVKSHGVLVSEQELGLAEKSTEVIVLEKGEAGGLFTTVFDDVVLDMSTTPNRPDWLSVDGIARELATGLDIGYPKRSFLNKYMDRKQINRSGGFPIKIKDLQGCPRYTARIFDNIVVKNSPFWMKWRLHCMGMNPVNNIVDITNIIMLLTGQPLHPFNLDLLKNYIVIRKARSGEKFVTLEGTMLKLNKDDLIIADKDGPVALAGVIGGRRAQISNSTKRVLLESAYFNPKRIAHTGRRLDLKTEASLRFEQNADIFVVDGASAITGNLFRQYAHARECEFVSSGKKAKTKYIKFSSNRLNKILTLNLTKNQIKAILNRIHIHTTGEKPLIANIPHYRRDLHIEEDIYEEVARIFGYMKIPEKTPIRWGGHVLIDKKRLNKETIRNYLIGQGFSETYNFSLTASRRLSDFGFNKYVKIKNPLNERFDALRPTLFIGLLDCVNYNLSKGYRSLKLFEIGNILLSETPYQETKLGVILGGIKYPDFWKQEKGIIDYFDAKGVVESIFNLVHIKEFKFREIKKKGFNQTVTILFSGKQLGYLGSIDECYCKEPYYYFELTMDKILSFVSEIFYIPPAKFPASTRDLSFLVDEKIKVPKIIELIKKVGGPILEKVTLFDYYKGQNLPSGKKNLGFRLYFRAPDRTLTDKEVTIFIKKIEDEISTKFNAKLRNKELVWTT